LDLRPGSLIFGSDQSDSYRIEEFINSGGFGLVYKICRTSDAGIFALKTIITASLDDSQVAALVNEGNLATKIDHPNVVKYIFFHDGQQHPNLPPYIIMEYADGGDLGHLINQRREDNDFFSMQELRTMLLQLAQGMQAINQRLIHRDIRPSNILLARDSLKISDFGLSKVVGQATRSRTFKGIQHIAYMAPEAWKLETNTIQMDIYSMGIVFYELSTLKHPYNVAQDVGQFEAWRQAHLLQVPKPPDAMNPSIPSYLAQVIMRMIAKRPQDRHDSWDDIIERIDRANGEVASQTSVKLQDLIQTARNVQHQRDTEQAHRLMEQERNQERQEVVTFQAEQLHGEIKHIIDQFNKEFDGPPLQLEKESQDWLYGFRPFMWISGRGGRVRIVITYLERWSGQEQMIFKNRPVYAWGCVLADSGKSFDLLLVPDSEGDLYGSWRIVHSHLTPKSPFDPLPNRMRELAKLLPSLDSVPFDSAPLISLLGEVV